jgi:spore maturation protein CgeB
MKTKMRLIFLGLSLSSSWGNGHATTYRALLRGLHQSGHDVLFLEREQPWYAEHRDLASPDYCSLRFYNRLTDLDRFLHEFAQADAVIIGSYVPDGIEAINHVAQHVRGLLCFYDIDTPVTLHALEENHAAYLATAQIGLFDIYLSFTGGPTLRLLERRYGARMARALYCAVDPEQHAPLKAPPRWDLGYIGTYSEDRQPALERLLIKPARQRPDLRFIVAGPLYPAGIEWPANVERIDHVPPAEHPAFYASLRWTLNITRADMRRHGYSPSVRLFEAAACGAPVVSDNWPGLPTLFTPGREIIIAETSDDVLATLAMEESRRLSLRSAARARTLDQHSAARRAQELEAYLEEALLRRDLRGGARAPAVEGVQA